MFYRRGTSLCILLMILSLLAAGCGSGSNLVTSGILTVGSDTNAPPQEFANPTAEGFTGFDIDLITTIAHRMGLKTNIVTTGFDKILDGLNAKRFDVVISSMGITDARKQKADFVHYFNTGTSLLVQKGNPKHINSPSDLCGLNVGVQEGTIEQDALTLANLACQAQKKPDIRISTLQEQIDLVEALLTNKVDATYQDSPVTIYYQKQNPEAFELGGPPTNIIPEGIAVRKGDTAMLNAVQAAFKQLKADGTYHTLLVKWGLESGEVTLADQHSF